MGPPGTDERGVGMSHQPPVGDYSGDRSRDWNQPPAIPTYGDPAYGPPAANPGQPDPARRYQDQQHQDQRYDQPYQNPHNQDPQYQDPRNQDPRYQDSPYQNSQYRDSEYQNSPHQDPQYQDPQYQDPQYQNSQYQASQYQQQTQTQYDIPPIPGAPTLPPRKRLGTGGIVAIVSAAAVVVLLIAGGAYAVWIRSSLNNVWVQYSAQGFYGATVESVTYSDTEAGSSTSTATVSQERWSNMARTPRTTVDLRVSSASTSSPGSSVSCLIAVKGKVVSANTDPTQATCTAKVR